MKLRLLSLILLTSIDITCGIAMQNEEDPNPKNPRSTRPPFLYSKNIGRIQAASGEMATAVMLNSELIVGPAHTACLYNSAEDQIFIQSINYTALISCDLRTGIARLDLTSTEKKLIEKGISYSRYDVIYLPQKLAYKAPGWEIDHNDSEKLIATTKALFDKQLNIDLLLKEDSGIDGFTYPEGDWAILKLRKPIDVKTLPIEIFSGADLSGLEGICVGAETQVEMMGEKCFCPVTPKIINLKPLYYKGKSIFYTSVLTKGAQDDTGILEKSELPKNLATGSMSGAPVFFLKGDKWILGANLSTNLCDRMLVQFHRVSEDPEYPEGIRENAASIVTEFKDELYPVYTLYASLEGLHNKIQENLSLRK